MKTRTLLLLALACGLAIMLAGAVFLFQLTRQDPVAEPVPIGTPVDVGDMTVVVDAADERDGVLTIDVRIGGVDDPDGASGFQLNMSGRLVRPDPGDDRCGATEIAEVACVLVFDTAEADGVARVLLYERGDEQVRWVLA